MNEDIQKAIKKEDIFGWCAYAISIHNFSLFLEQQMMMLMVCALMCLKQCSSTEVLLIYINVCNM